VVVAAWPSSYSLTASQSGQSGRGRSLDLTSPPQCPAFRQGSGFLRGGGILVPEFWEELRDPVRHSAGLGDSMSCLAVSKPLSVSQALHFAAWELLSKFT
jgi:hypothetical protein